MTNSDGPASAAETSGLGAARHSARVSVIVPLYNKEATVARTLASIGAQSFSDFEVIVVDDGSTDAGPKVVEEFHDTRFRLLRQKNMGPGAARNRGIAEACGEYLAFLDADDEWLPTYLERSVAVLDAHSSVASVSWAYIEYPSGRSTSALWGRRGVREGMYQVGRGTDIRGLLGALAIMGPQLTVARRAIVVAAGGFFDQNRCLYGEDAFLFFRILSKWPVWLSTEPQVIIHTEASGLNIRASRFGHFEPFLEHPDEALALVSEETAAKMAELLAARAFKRACVFAFYGQFRRARKLRRDFVAYGRAGTPFYWMSAIATSPLGLGLLIWRMAQARMRRRIGPRASPATR